MSDFSDPLRVKSLKQAEDDIPVTLLWLFIIRTGKELNQMA